ncbi:hypothetical protein AB1Y20_002113 [Prymnesium parvum]|uniref:Fatty acyl-CoA reductase n=1 Tax=Prymnesium parvum TaxID=97485 RepID=A0AB34J863_PRYPA
MFTSGSTGTPKPRWMDEGLWAQRNGRGAAGVGGVSVVAVFSPLSHGLARRQVWREAMHGGRLAVLSPADDLLAQLAVVQPSSLTAVPKFFSLLRRVYDDERARGEERGEGGEGGEGAAMRRTRARLGRRLRHIGVGGAVVPYALLEFLRRCFGIGGDGGGNCIVSEGYGATETGGITRDGELLPQWRPPLGEARLDEAKGAALGQPAGVGEILLRAHGRVITGETDADGWYATGDLGVWEKGGARLRVVDRASAALKLANGEFVCPARLEALFEARCPLVEEVCVLAAAGDDRLTVVAVPRGVGSEAGGKQAEGSEAAVLVQLREAAVAARLPPHEVPASVVLDWEAWGVGNGCRGSGGKLIRHAICARVGRRRGAAPPLDAQVVGYLRAADEAEAAAHLAGVEAGSLLCHVGGDSIVAARVAEAVADGRVGVRALLATPLQQLRATLRGGGGGGGEAEVCWEAELAWQGGGKAAGGQGEGGEAEGEEAVLLTGATGFLGPHLLEALLAAPALRGCLVVCLCRPPLGRVAVPRGASRRVRLVAAELSAAGLGVAAEDWAWLRALRVRLLVHSAAAVDHARPYAQLRHVNVRSVDALLALLSPSAHVVFVSSLAATAPGGEERVGGEAEGVPSSGYGQSKWVCERRLCAALARGQLGRLSIARLGLLGPHRTSGAPNPTDWLHRFLRAVAAARAAPAFAGGMEVEMLPVDVAARAVVQMAAAAGRRAEARVAHLDAAAFAVRRADVERMVGALEACEGAAYARGVEYAAWRREVLRVGGGAEAALALLPADARRFPSSGGVRIAREEGRRLAAELGEGASAPWDDARLWRRWAAAFRPHLAGRKGEAASQP